MALKQGLNFTASDAKKLLEKNDRQQDGVRTWQKIFGTTSLASNVQGDALAESYSDIIAQAYQSNYNQQNMLSNIGYNTNATNRFIDMTKQDLHNTYLKYVQNYRKDATTLADTYNSTFNALNEGLNERATNMADILSKGYDYLSTELYPANGYLDSIQSDVSKLDWLYNDDNTLKDWDTLSQSLVDDNGVLTDEGRQYFDLILNAQPQSFSTGNIDNNGNEIMARSFGQWLSDNHNELYNWYGGADAFNDTRASTNAGTIKSLLGLESDDQLYRGSEHINNLKDNSNLLTSVTSTVDKDGNKLYNINSDKIASDINRLKQTYGSTAFTDEMNDSINTSLREYNKWETLRKEIGGKNKSGLLSYLLNYVDITNVKDLQSALSRKGASYLYDIYSGMTDDGRTVEESSTTFKNNYNKASNDLGKIMTDVFDKVQNNAKYNGKTGR